MGKYLDNWQRKFIHYKTGIPECDEPHFHLFEMFDELVACDSDKERVVKSLEIMDHWYLHIKQEENFMERINFPWTKRHKEEHDKLGEILKRMIGYSLKMELNMKVSSFCYTLIDHIDQFDLQYAEWYRNNAEIRNNTETK